MGTSVRGRDSWDPRLYLQGPPTRGRGRGESSLQGRPRAFCASQAYGSGERAGLSPHLEEDESPALPPAPAFLSRLTGRGWDQRPVSIARRRPGPSPHASARTSGAPG